MQCGVVECSTPYSGGRYTEPDLGEALVALDEPLVGEGLVVSVLADGLLGVLHRGPHLGLGLDVGLGLGQERTGKDRTGQDYSTEESSVLSPQ